MNHIGSPHPPARRPRPYVPCLPLYREHACSSPLVALPQGGSAPPQHPVLRARGGDTRAARPLIPVPA
eukprot:5609514-Pleurochrysis_carterae.AAC.1